MMGKIIKSIIMVAGFGATIFLFNFFSFNYFYNRLATPYLSEEQRMEGWQVTITQMVPINAVFAFAISGLMYVVMRRSR